MVTLPPDIESVIDRSWERTNRVPGHLGENEARFLGLLAACVPAEGVILEIGSFKGKSTVMLASVSSHYQRSPVVAIDPHTAPSVTDPKTEKGSSTFEEFKESLDKAQVTSSVEVHRAYSAEIAKSWNRPIRLLWIDGDHTYQGVRQDFGNYSPFLAPGGIVAFHDCLNAFEGPIRVFTESVLRDNRFGASGFVQSIGWSQLLPAHTHTHTLSLSLSLSLKTTWTFGAPRITVASFPRQWQASPRPEQNCLQASTLSHSSSPNFASPMGRHDFLTRESAPGNTTIPGCVQRSSRHLSLTTPRSPKNKKAPSVFLTRAALSLR